MTYENSRLKLTKKMNTVIFDMDGLLVDSEPIWEEATNEIFATKGLHITHQQYETSIGLRTAEFLEHWFNHFNLDKTLLKSWEELLFESVIYKVKTKGKIMPGVDYIFNFFKERDYKIGLASSSPMSLINAVVEMLDAKNIFQTVTSAQDLAYGKPNPQVYLDCAVALQSNSIDCICFEDSINGMIAAKAAKMKCVVVPSLSQNKDQRWSLADLQLSSLQNFGGLHLQKIENVI